MRKHVHVIYVNIGWGDFGQFYGGKTILFGYMYLSWLLHTARGD